MKIIDKRKCQPIDFDELDVGDYFMHGELLYVKTLPFGYEGYKYNSVRLNDGGFMNFNNWGNVDPVNVIMFLENKTEE